MGYWSIYFLAKLGLFHGGYIGFHWLANLIFAIVLVLPLVSVRYQLIRKGLAFPVALALLYYDSWLPPILRTLSQMGNLAGFDRGYLLELLSRFVNPWVVASIVALLLFFLLLRRHLRFATLVFLGILNVAFSHVQNNATSSVVTNQASAGTIVQDPSAKLAAFYAEEQRKRVTFQSITNSSAPFDVIFLHICSLSWDDLNYIGEGSEPLLKRFDVVFHDFNSAASYSGPAALRLFHSNCGQLPHNALYEPGQQQCNLFKSFEEAGFDVHGLLNHDGHFDQFSATVEGESGIGRKLENNRFAPVIMRSFDDTPIYEDYDLLSGWWAQQGNATKPRALYYNTISLHDGNIIPGVSSRSSLQTYKPRLDKLMSDFDRFITFLEHNGRPVVVVLLPEHGANLRGDKMQISGMREIPSPGITIVPAAIKLIGFKGHLAEPIQVDNPVSYTAISALLANFIADSPFTATGGKPLAERVKSLPKTPYLSENADVVLMKRDNGYVLRSQDGTWVDYQLAP